MSGNATDLPLIANLPVASRERLESLALLLEKWNASINLVARSSLPDIWTRHFADSAQLFGYRPPQARHWLDLGSGGGFPGLVVAILARDDAPDLRVELVESDQRKCVFLHTAAQTLGLAVTITRARIETLPPRQVDVISARALASLDQLCRYAVPHLAPDGICLFLKGSGVEAEVAQARREFSFDLEILPSAADRSGAVLKMAGLVHV